MVLFLFTISSLSNKDTILVYVKEAIKNQKLGKEIKPTRSKKETIIPDELETRILLHVRTPYLPVISVVHV